MNTRKLIVQKLDETCGVWITLNTITVEPSFRKVWRFGWKGFYQIDVQTHFKKDYIIAARMKAFEIAEHYVNMNTYVRIEDESIRDGESVAWPITIWQNGQWLNTLEN
jgi:hypothetical protein